MKFVLLFSLVLSGSFAFSQNTIPEFGDFTGAEISLKECDFDKEADAVILLDVANSNYNDQYNLLTDRRIRLKILKQKGVDKANIEIPYYGRDDFETILNIRAITYSRGNNGEVSLKELDKKTIFRQKLNQRISVLKFTLPDVKVGTIVEYQYQTIAKHYGGLQDWYFQSEMPTVLSSYSLTIIPNGQFTYVVRKSPDIPVQVKSDKRNGQIRFEMKNIAGLRYEPFMNAPKDYLQHVEFQFAGYTSQSGSIINYMTTWKEFAKELSGANYFGKQLEKKLADPEQLMAKVSALSTPYDKMKFIYSYVTSTISWNNINTKFADEGIKRVWEDKKGTSGEINLILINLLKEAGLKVDPLLVSERRHGIVNTEYPMLDQFNKVMAYLVIDNRQYVLDASSVNTPVDVIPFTVLNTNAFIVNNKKPEVIRLTDTKGASNLINIYSTINSSGVVVGYARINSFNYEKINRLEDYRKSPEGYQHDYFKKDHTEISIDSFTVSNIDMDSLALLQQFKFTMAATSSGEYKLINTNLFSGLQKNVFTLNNRFTDVDFGCMQNTDIFESFELPANMKADEIPKNIQLVTPDKSLSFKRVVSVDANTVNIQLSLKIDKTSFSVEDYPTLKEFYKKMHNLLGEQIVLLNK